MKSYLHVDFEFVSPNSATDILIHYLTQWLTFARRLLICITKFSNWHPDPLSYAMTHRWGPISCTWSYVEHVVCILSTLLAQESPCMCTSLHNLMCPCPCPSICEITTQQCRVLILVFLLDIPSLLHCFHATIS